MPSQTTDGLYQRSDSPYWWASFVDASGKRTRRSTKTQDRREAEALLSKWRLESFQARQWGVEPSRSFDELMLAYLKGPGREKRSALRDHFSAQHLYPRFTGRDLNQLGPQDVRAYIDARKAEGAKGSTINREIGLLRAAINYARQEWGWNIPNPALGKQEPEQGRIRWLTRNEAARLLQAARASKRSPWQADFIRLGLHTGMRSGEMLGMRWDQVDLGEGLIYLDPEDQKNGRPGSVPLNAEARAALVARAQFKARFCPDSPWVFCHQDGSRVASIKKGFQNACERAGITDLVPHDLRHTCAAWLVQAGVPLTEVRDLLRHSSVRVTERYAHLAPHRVRAAVQHLEGASSRLRHGEDEEGGTGSG